MNEKRAKVIIDLLYREIENELGYNSEDKTYFNELIDSYIDFNKSQFSGLDRLSNTQLLSALVKEYK